MTTVNLSLSGALASCATSSPELLCSHLEGCDMRLDLWLPAGGRIALTARIVHLLSRDGECLIGFEFRAFEPSGFQLLRNFLMRRAGPESVRATGSR